MLPAFRRSRKGRLTGYLKVRLTYTKGSINPLAVANDQVSRRHGRVRLSRDDRSSRLSSCAQRSQLQMSEQQRVRFAPERYRREAARVRREAAATQNEVVRRQLLDIAERFDAVAEIMESDGSAS